MQDHERVRRVHRGDSKHSVSVTLEVAPVPASISVVGGDTEAPPDI